ncbi:hypothetical protein AAF712_015678 [Marasmius tenuissimus]|uniref:F-box domain-containing protein n=1 Tax=Marasmius tenuissimus TaxID=585030 RepID=A0ABR2Z8Q8_9AGAR
MTPTHARDLPCEIVREILNEYFIKTFFQVQVHTGVVDVVHNDTSRKLDDSDLEKLCGVCDGWRAIIEGLRVWQRIEVNLQYDRLQWDGNGCLTTPDERELKRLINMAEERGRGLDITLAVRGRPLNPGRYPVLKLLVSAAARWGSFRFVARAGVDIGLTCSLMSLVRPKLEGCKVLGVVINDNVVTGERKTIRDLVETWEGMHELDHLRLSWLPLQYKRVWSWGSVGELRASWLYRIRRLEVACTPATALWLLRQCRNVERASLSLEYEEEAFQRRGLEEADVELTKLEKLAISVTNTIVKKTFPMLMHYLVCPQLRILSMEWFLKPSGMDVDAVNAFLERTGGVDGRVYLTYGGPAEEKPYSNLNMCLFVH